LIVRASIFAIPMYRIYALYLRKPYKKMKKCLLFILLVGILASCSNDRRKRNARRHAGATGSEMPDTVTITANEAEGIKDITNFYGGTTKHSIGRTLDANRKYFQVHVSNSDAIENTKNIIGLSAANMACMVYQNLLEDKNKYDEIRVQITFKDGESVEQGYPVSTLALVISKMKVVQIVVGLLKEKNYKGLGAVLNDKSSAGNYDKNKLIKEIQKADAPLGNIEMFVPYGYAFHKADDGKSLLHISGVLKRDKQNNEFSVIMDPESTKDEVLMINYRL
jgi:hypothetical protein